MSNEIENGRYLPVLYMIPKDKLILGSGRHTKYYVYWIDSYVSSVSLKRVLKDLGKTPQDWYDRWILGITVPSDRPKCIICGNECTYDRLSIGYYKVCKNTSCINKSTSISMKKCLNTPEIKEKLSNSQKKRFEDPKEREKLSEYSKNMWKNDDIRDRILSTRSETYKNHPEISEKKSKSMKITTNTPEYKKMCSDRMKERWKDENYRKERHEILNNIWENPTDTVLNFPRSKPNTSKLYSEYEDKEIYLDSSWEVAFYIYNSLLNKEVKIIYREPIGITYINPFDSLTHKYFPDFYIIYEDGYQELIEIKPEYNLEDEVVKSKLNAAKDICYLTGISFRIVTDDEIKSMKRELSINNINYNIDK